MFFWDHISLDGREFANSVGGALLFWEQEYFSKGQKFG